jgi:hypothetical protein
MVQRRRINADGTPVEDSRPCTVCGITNVILWRCDICRCVVCDACHIIGECKACYENTDLETVRRRILEGID